MFRPPDIAEELRRVRHRTRSAQEELVSEANRILRDDLYSEKKVLDHLGSYGQRFMTLDEDQVDATQVFTREEIRTICTRQRMRFLDSTFYKPDIPQEALSEIRHLERRYRTELRHFMVMAYPAAFRLQHDDHATLLFARTNHDNYYLVHRWGKKPHWSRWLVYWPLRRFENLVLTVIAATMLITLALPTWLITLDSSAQYWSGYRAAAFMHLLIFNAGITAYLTFAFSRNFSSTVWNRKKDFD